MVSIAPLYNTYTSQTTHVYEPAPIIVDEMQTQILELRALETNLWSEVELQRQYCEQLEYERSMLSMQLNDATARDAVHTAQLQNLLGNYEVEISRTAGDRDRLAALLSNTSQELRFKEEMIVSSESRIHEMEGIIASTQGNLSQWQGMYQEIQVRFADMQAQFETSRSAALQLTELLRQKDMQLAAESQRFNEVIRQRDSELGYANTLLRAKDEEISALRAETMALRMVPPTVIERTVVQPPVPTVTEYVTHSTGPEMSVLDWNNTMITDAYTPIMAETVMTDTSYITPPVIAPMAASSVVYEQPMMMESMMAPTILPTTTYTTISDPLLTATPIIGTPVAPLEQQHRPGRLKVLVTEGTDFSRKHRHPYVLLTVGSHTTHTHATKRDRQRHVAWNEMAEFDVQDASTEILRVSIAEKHRIRHDEKFAASRPIPLAQLPYNTPRSFTADTGLGRVNLQLEFLPPAGFNNQHHNNPLGALGYTPTQNRNYTTF